MLYKVVASADENIPKFHWADDIVRDSKSAEHSCMFELGGLEEGSILLKMLNRKK